jgi:hypothetical protein
MNRDPLASGGWFNSSSRLLRVSAVVVGLGFALFCLATWFFVAQYFACIGNCSPGSSALPLVAMSVLLGLVPALLTAAMGYFIVKGLWEDGKQKAAEARRAAPAKPTSAATPAPPQPADIKRPQPSNS